MGDFESRDWWNKMWKFAFSSCHLRLRSSAGYALPLILVALAVLTISGTAFLCMYGGEHKIAAARANKKKAWYCAESGLRKAIWRMSRQPLEQIAAWGTFSESNMSVVYDSSTGILTSTGSCGGQAATVSVTLFCDATNDHLLSYTDDFTIKGTAGTISYPEGTEPQECETLPAIDMAFYRSIADTVYGTESTPVEQDFNSTLPEGIHFIYGTANMKNGTFLNGSFIVTSDIRFSGTVIINAQQAPPSSPYYPAYYPAVVCSGDSLSTVFGTSQNVVICGMVYSSGEVIFNTINLTGSIIAPSIQLAGSFTAVYDTIYAGQLPGVTYPPGSYTLSMGSWVF